MAKETNNRIWKLTLAIASMVLVFGLMIPMTAIADSGSSGETELGAEPSLNYFLIGGTAVKADEILQELSLMGKTAQVEGSPDDEYFHGEQREDGWYVVVDKAFEGTKILRILVQVGSSDDYDMYEINVTSNCVTSYDDLKDKCAKGGTWEVTESFQGYSDDGITVPEGVEVNLSMIHNKSVSGPFSFNVQGKLNLSQGVFISTHFILSGNAEVSISGCDISFGTASEPAADEKPPAENFSYGTGIEVKDNAKLTLSSGFRIARYSYGIYASGGTVNASSGSFEMNGYGVWVEGTGNCTVTDCSLGENDYGAHIQDDGAKLEVNGNTDIGGSICGVIVDSGTFQIQGAPRITGNIEDPSNDPHDVILHPGTVINVVGKLDSSSAIGVKTKDEPAEGKTVPVTKGLKGNGTVASFSSNISNWTITEDSAGEAVMAVQSSIDPSAYSEMYRLYNPNTGEHFYTGNPEERDAVIAAGWNDEGIGWYAPTDQSIPVYRLYNQFGGEHHYTMDSLERDMLVGAGWIDEGTGWYSDPGEGSPLLREYNPNAFACNHNYTTNQDEHAYLVSIGWRDEGTAWFAVAPGK